MEEIPWPSALLSIHLTAHCCMCDGADALISGLNKLTYDSIVPRREQQNGIKMSMVSNFHDWGVGPAGIDRYLSQAFPRHSPQSVGS